MKNSNLTNINEKAGIEKYLLDGDFCNIISNLIELNEDNSFLISSISLSNLFSLSNNNKNLNCLIYYNDFEQTNLNNFNIIKNKINKCKLILNKTLLKDNNILQNPNQDSLDTCTSERNKKLDLLNQSFSNTIYIKEIIKNFYKKRVIEKSSKNNISFSLKDNLNNNLNINLSPNRNSNLTSIINKKSKLVMDDVKDPSIRSFVENTSLIFNFMFSMKGEINNSLDFINFREGLYVPTNSYITSNINLSPNKINNSNNNVKRENSCNNNDYHIDKNKIKISKKTDKLYNTNYLDIIDKYFIKINELASDKDILLKSKNYNKKTLRNNSLNLFDLLNTLYLNAFLDERSNNNIILNKNANRSNIEFVNKDIKISESNNYNLSTIMLIIYENAIVYYNNDHYIINLTFSTYKELLNISLSKNYIEKFNIINWEHNLFTNLDHIFKSLISVYNYCLNFKNISNILNLYAIFYDIIYILALIKEIINTLIEISIYINKLASILQTSIKKETDYFSKTSEKSNQNKPKSSLKSKLSNNEFKIFEIYANENIIKNDNDSKENQSFDNNRSFDYIFFAQYLNNTIEKLYLTILPILDILLSEIIEYINNCEKVILNNENKNISRHTKTHFKLKSKGFNCFDFLIKLKENFFISFIKTHNTNIILYRKINENKDINIYKLLNSRISNFNVPNFKCVEELELKINILIKKMYFIDSILYDIDKKSSKKNNLYSIDYCIIKQDLNIQLYLVIEYISIIKKQNIILSKEYSSLNEDSNLNNINLKENNILDNILNLLNINGLCSESKTIFNNIELISSSIIENIYNFLKQYLESYYNSNLNSNNTIDSKNLNKINEVKDNLNFNNNQSCFDFKFNDMFFTVFNLNEIDFIIKEYNSTLNNNYLIENLDDILVKFNYLFIKSILLYKLAISLYSLGYLYQNKINILKEKNSIHMLSAIMFKKTNVNSDFKLGNLLLKIKKNNENIINCYKISSKKYTQIIDILNSVFTTNKNFIKLMSLTTTNNKNNYDINKYSFILQSINKPILNLICISRFNIAAITNICFNYTNKLYWSTNNIETGDINELKNNIHNINKIYLDNNDDTVIDSYIVKNNSSNKNLLTPNNANNFNFANSFLDSFNIIYKYINIQSAINDTNNINENKVLFSKAIRDLSLTIVDFTDLCKDENTIEIKNINFINHVQNEIDIDSTISIKFKIIIINSLILRSKLELSFNLFKEAQNSANTSLSIINSNSFLPENYLEDKSNILKQDKKYYIQFQVLKYECYLVLIICSIYKKLYDKDLLNLLKLIKESMLILLNNKKYIYSGSLIFNFNKLVSIFFILKKKYINYKPKNLSDFESIIIDLFETFKAYFLDFINIDLFVILLFEENSNDSYIIDNEKYIRSEIIHMNYNNSFNYKINKQRFETYYNFTLYAISEFRNFKYINMSIIITKKIIDIIDRLLKNNISNSIEFIDNINSKFDKELVNVNNLENNLISNDISLIAYSNYEKKSLVSNKVFSNSNILSNHKLSSITQLSKEFHSFLNLDNIMQKDVNTKIINKKANYILKTSNNSPNKSFNDVNKNSTNNLDKKYKNSKFNANILDKYNHNDLNFSPIKKRKKSSFCLNNNSNFDISDINISLNNKNKISCNNNLPNESTCINPIEKKVPVNFVDKNLICIKCELQRLSLINKLIDMLISLGKDYLSIKNYNHSLNCYKLALENAKTNFPEDLLKISDIYFKISIAYDKQKMYKESLDYKLKILKIKEMELSNSDPDYIEAIYLVTMQYCKLNMFSEALSYANRLDNLYSLIYGIYSNKTGESKLILADIYILMKDYEKAYDINEKSLRIFENLVKDQHKHQYNKNIDNAFNVNNSLNNTYNQCNEKFSNINKEYNSYIKSIAIKGLCLGKTNNFKEAVKLLTKNINKIEKVLTTKNKLYKECLLEIAYCFEKLKNKANSIYYYTKVLNIIGSGNITFQNIQGKIDYLVS